MTVLFEMEMELTETEQDRLAELETVIDRGQKVFVEVGLALAEIRDKKLFRETHKTFEEYCGEKWGFSSVRAKQLIDGAVVAKNIETIVSMNVAEAHLRPLSKLQPDMQREVYQEAVDTAPNGKVTAAHVESVVRRFVPPVAPDEDEQHLEELDEEPTGYNWTVDEPSPVGKMAVHYSSDKMDWETPQELFDLLNAEFNFTLDVCATPYTAKCAAYFTPEDDGLAQDWSKQVGWMNPPYGDEISDWVDKAQDEARKGATVVCLVPARVDTAWWWDNCIHGEIRFLKGRLKFKQNGNQESGAPFPSAVVIFSPTTKPQTVWWDWKRNIRF